MAEDEVEPVVAYLRDRNVSFRQREGGNYSHEYVEFRYIGNHVNIDCSIHYTKGALIYTVFAMVQDEMNPDKRGEILALANHANRGVKFGSMIVGDDGPSGQFRVWVRLSNADADTPEFVVIMAMIENACGMMERYYPAIMKVVWGGLSAEEALEFLWEDDDDDDDDSDPPPPISGYA